MEPAVLEAIAPVMVAPMRATTSIGDRDESSQSRASSSADDLRAYILSPRCTSMTLF